MEGVKSFWVINKTYNDVKEFHFTSDIASFVVYFKNEEIAFVLDNTCDIVSPNNLLIIAPLPEDIGKKIPATKWDSILKNKFGINPINIRPKENTKYKKLDISYTNLDLYASFSSIQSDETLDLIMQNREILSLSNAYDREAENLLEYNKSTQTIEKSNKTLEGLKKRLLNISKRLKKQKELEEKDPEKINEELRASLVKKLYDATEKLKRAERRIKRAKKRADSAFEDLSLKRIQIQEIKKRIEARENFNKEEEKVLDEKNTRILSHYEIKDSLYEQKNKIENNSNIQDVKTNVIEKLTTENLNAKNEEGEILGTTLSVKENTMAKETENKSLKQTAEFKPPFVDDTAMEQPKKSNEIQFTKKNELFDDKYKKAWIYALSVIASIVIVFGLFFFLSGDDETSYVNEDVYNTQYLEQDYTNPQPEMPEEKVVEEEVVVVEETPVEEKVVMEEEAPVVFDAPEEEEVPVVKEEKVAPVPTPAPVVEKKPVYKAPVKPIAKAPVKKVAPAPVKKKVEPVKPVIVEEEVIVNVPEEDDEEYIEEEEIIEEDEEEISLVGEEVVLPEDSQEDLEEDVEEEEVAEVSALEIAKKQYVDNVLAGDAYLKLIDYLKNNFFLIEDASKIAELEKMNHYWNDFRNEVYDTYYDSDYTLKEDIDYEEYANDEYLLRIYTNAYYDFYEYIVNEFVMTYEYANNTATDLYAQMEDELQVLGRPLTKLAILAKVYNAVQAEGGPKAVLSAINLKDEKEEIAANSMEIEATLIPLTATTQIVYQEELYLDNDVEVVSQETTEVVEDLSNEYAASEEILEVSPQDLEKEEIETAENIETVDMTEEETDDEENLEVVNSENSENETETLLITTEETVVEEVATNDDSQNLEVVVEEDEEIAQMSDEEEEDVEEEEELVSSDDEEVEEDEEEVVSSEEEEVDEEVATNDDSQNLEVVVEEDEEIAQMSDEEEEDIEEEEVVSSDDEEVEEDEEEVVSSEEDDDEYYDDEDEAEYSETEEVIEEEV